MAEQTDQVRATRALLAEVCALFAAHGEDTVLVGGWVPDVRFPAASPAHIGSIDIDIALRLGRQAHEAIVALLLANGFRRGANQYQFLKDMAIGRGKTVAAQLDLLTSASHHAETFLDSPIAPHPIRGAEIAFQDNSVEPIAVPDGAQVRVAGIVAFIVMKSIALASRFKPKDAYDIHFCLENYPDGLPGLVREFTPFLGEPIVREGLTKLAARFKNEDDEGPRMVVDVEGIMGEYRSIRKLAVFSRVSDMLKALSVTASDAQ